MEFERETLYVEGIAAIAEGRFDEGIDLLVKVVESPDWAIDFGRREHARMALGFAYARTEAWPKAIECFKKVSENDAQCLPAQTALGHAYLMTNRVDEAIEIFKSVLQRDGANEQARHGLGWSLLVQGKDLKEALYQASEALRLNSASAPIRDTVGWILYKTGDPEAALEQLDEAVRLDPDHPEILAHRREVKEAIRKKKG